MQGLFNVLTVVNTVLIVGGIGLVSWSTHEEDKSNGNISSKMWFEEAYNDEKHSITKTHAPKSQTRTPKVAAKAKKAPVARTKKRPATRQNSR